MGDALAARTAEQPLLTGRVLRVLTDEKLAAMVAAGSEDAFADLYRRYHQPIYRYCLSTLGQEADARDALQSSMVAALSSLRSRPIEGAFKPWLYRIAHNQSISIIRGRGREAPTDAPSTAAVTDDPELREQLRTLVSDLGALPDRQRGAIVMRELSGLSYTAIGTALGTSEAGGKQLVYEARSALQDLREGHEMSCELVRERISARDRRLLRGRKVRAHLRGCQPCQDFDEAIRRRRPALALLAPPLSPLIAAAVLKDVFAGGGTSGGAAAGGGAAGAAGIAAGGVPAVAGPVAMKLAAAVLLAGAAGVGAYEAGSAIFSDSVTPTPAAVKERAHAGGRAERHDAGAKPGHAARAQPAHERAGGAGARAAVRDKGQATAGGDAAAGAPVPGDQSSTDTAAAPASAGSAGTTSSEPAGSGGSNEGATGSSGGDAAGGGSAGGGGTSGGGTAGGTTGGGSTSGGSTGGGSTGGGSTGGGGDPPTPDPTTTPTPPTPPTTAPPGTPPGHGGVPPSQGGVPPGQAGGSVPPGWNNNPGHGGGK